MKAQVERMEKPPVGLEELGIPLSLKHDEERMMIHFIKMSAIMYRGKVGDRVACVWGLIPPTILSQQAYLWLFTTDLVDQHQFMFVRHSQRAMEMMLEEYPTIIGHASEGNDRGIRWLKWLGAEFGEPKGRNIPFTIRKKDGSA